MSFKTRMEDPVSIPLLTRIAVGECVPAVGRPKDVERHQLWGLSLLCGSPTDFFLNFNAKSYILVQ